MKSKRTTKVLKKENNRFLKEIHKRKNKTITKEMIQRALRVQEEE